MNNLQFKKAFGAAGELLLFQNVLAAAPSQIFMQLVKLLATSEENQLDPFQLSTLYGRLFRELASQQNEGFCKDWWQNYLIKRILADQNPFSTQAYRHNGKIDQIVELAARHDLTLLQMLFKIDGLQLETAFSEIQSYTTNLPLVGWHNSPLPLAQSESPEASIIQKFGQSEKWEELMPDLLNYYAQFGTDELARGRAFRWQRSSEGSYFEPVSQVDPARLENLIGYERVRQPLIQNTEQFLAGLPANNALLYGARGTGKSSTVKALLNRYGVQGLRLIEVHKNWLGDYPLIVEKVRERREKFILFVDDLSFEADEVAYKDLKALLEGSIEARPANLLIYATSNRRHLVKEQFSDNGRPEDTEISAWDTVEEKLSLSDRFGLTLTFSPPSQPQYLSIVRGLAQQANLQLDTAELERRALQWEMRHSGFSGRVARQFIDQLAGEIQLNNIRKG